MTKCILNKGQPTRVYFSKQYLASEYAFDTTRKAGWIAESLTDRAIVGVELFEPDLLTAEDLATVHDPEYIRAVQTGEPRSLAQSQGFDWGPCLFPAVCASNGGMVAATLEAMRSGVSGSLSSGLHHARHSRGAGFCTFNGLVIAAKKAQETGSKSVLILDLDAHCGGGTASLIEGIATIRQLDVSVSAYDQYDSRRQSQLILVRKAEEYLPTIREGLEGLTENLPDLCIYNAGMDPFEGCSTGGLEGITAKMLRERERLVFGYFRSRGIPIAFALAGGYVGSNLSQASLVDLHRMTLEAAANRTEA